MDNPLYPATVTIGGVTTTYNALKVLGARIHEDQSFDLQYTLVKADGTTPHDISGSTSVLRVSAYKGSGYDAVVLVSGVHSDSGSGTTDRATYTVAENAIPGDIADFPLRNPGNAVFYAIITDGAGKKIEIVAEVNIFNTDYTLTGEAAPSERVIIPKGNDLGTVENLTTTTPPTATLNIAYIVGTGATGVWSGQDDDLAIGTGTAWVFLTPVEGNFVYDKVNNIQYVFDTAWTALTSAPFSDAEALVKNSADATKLIGFDASAITTGTERTITMPDADVDLTPGTGSFEEKLSGATLTAATVATGDKILGQDLDDAGNLKTYTAQSIADMGNLGATVLTIATGAITQTQLVHEVGTQAAAAADDLDSIVPATGQTELLLTMTASAQVPTIKHATGTNTFLLASDTDLVMVMNTFYHFHHDSTNWKLVGSSAAGGGGVVKQIKYTTDNTYVSTTSSIPDDNTIPQNTEGAEYTQLATAFTPLDAANNLIIEIWLPVTASNNNFGIAALFVDSDADALAVTSDSAFSNAITSGITFMFIVSAASTSARTYKLRYGTESTGTMYIGGDNAQLWSTAKPAYMKITEYTP